MHKWKLVDEGGPYGLTLRMAVPGGWIYRIHSKEGNGSVVVVFVPCENPGAY